MNILNIAKKEIKKDFRDIRTLVFMLAFPIVLMLILGTALSSTFTTSITVGEMNVLYEDTTGGAFSPYLGNFMKEAESAGIHFEKLGHGLNGKEEVTQNNYDGYVEITQSGMQLYLNERNSIAGNILQGMLTSFVDKANIASEVAKVAPSQMGAMFSGGTELNFIKETSLQPDQKPGSMDYYAIAMTTMIALYGAMSASSLILSERVRKTGIRLLASPVRKSEVFIGKVLGSIVLNTGCVLIVVLFSKIFYKVNWGDHFGPIFLVLLTEVLLAVSFGIGVSYMVKTPAGSRTILMIVIQLASFFGGAYFKFDNPEGFFQFVTNLSPLTWENTAINKIIYANDLSAAIPAVTFNIVVSFALLLIAVVSLKRREGF